MARRAAFAFIAAGVLLHVFTALFMAEGGFSAFLIGLLLWSWLPYALCFAFINTNAHAAVGGALFALAADGWAFQAAFIHPRGSTSSLILLFMPLWNAVLIAPVGGVIGWLIGRKATRRRS